MTGLPEVRMCASPDCGGVRACPDLDMSEPMLGTGHWVPTSHPSDESAVLRHLRQELAVSSASDTIGVQHMVPPVTFTVHKGTRGLNETDRAVLAQAGHFIGEGEYYFAAYGVPAGHRDALLAGQPRWSDELVAGRLAALRTAA